MKILTGVSSLEEYGPGRLRPDSLLRVLASGSMTTNLGTSRGLSASNQRQVPGRLMPMAGIPG